jgi:hypothetical protein
MKWDMQYVKNSKSGLIAVNHERTDLTFGELVLNILLTCKIYPVNWVRILKKKFLKQALRSMSNPVRKVNLTPMEEQTGKSFVAPNSNK